MKESIKKIPLQAITGICFVFLLSSCAPVRYESRISEPPKETSKPKASAVETTSFESKQIVASWYGQDFHGRPTSSGEIYNMYAKTCAHKELPFGTKLKVTNLSNSKATECTVTDRGPFIAGRDLDLSYACAKDIELIGTGTGRVRIDHLGRDMKYVKYIKYSSGSGIGPFTIQVGSFKEISNASRLKTALEFKYTKVYLTEADLDGNIYFRVRIGKFNSKEDAYALGKALADEGYNILITHYDERI